MTDRDADTDYASGALSKLLAFIMIVTGTGLMLMAACTPTLLPGGSP